MLNTTVILPVTASLPNKPSQGILTLNLNLKIIQAILPNVRAKTETISVLIRLMLVFFFFFFFPCSGALPANR